MTDLLAAIAQLPLPLVGLAFLASLALALAASAWFTRRLEYICAALHLSPGILSVLGALGANIPNYVAALDGLSSGRGDIGLGIILGSNIYNVAIILALSAFATPGRRGVVLHGKEARDVSTVAFYALAVLLLTLGLLWLLPGSPLHLTSFAASFAHFALTGVCLLALGVFAALVFHIVRRSHADPGDELAVVADVEARKSERTGREQGRLWRAVGAAVLALGLALGGVIIMVQAGQGLTADLHIPPVLTGLLVLAVATSLPNTVVAISLARADMHAANAEEIFSSNAVNAALGIALPLLLWPVALHDRLLPLLDAPLMVALTLAALLCLARGRVSRRAALLFLLLYAAWVGAHMLL